MNASETKEKPLCLWYLRLYIGFALEYKDLIIKYQPGMYLIKWPGTLFHRFLTMAESGATAGQINL